MKNTIIQGEITVLTANDVRAHRDINTVYNIFGKPTGDSQFTLLFPRQCTCAAVQTNLNAKFVLDCRGKITDVGENILMQTEIDGLFSKKLTNPTLRQVNSTYFTMNFTVVDVQPIFIVNAYSSDASSEGIAVVHLIGD